MDLYVADLTTIDPDLVNQIQQEMAGKIQEALPDTSLGRGVLHDRALHLSSILMAALEERIALVLGSRSLLDISDNPALADRSLVDRVLSNYRIVRQPGVSASGQITIVVDAPVPVTIPAGAVFTAIGVQFATTAAYAVRTSVASVGGSSDRVLRSLGNGNYAFTIPVTAVVAGSSGALRRGTGLVPAVVFPHFVAAYAEGDFSGGLDPESNSDMLRRLQEGLAVRAWSNRVSIDAMIRSQDRFARILAVSIIGFGDQEMIRDRHTIFPISLGGRCDLYARTATSPLSVGLRVACTFIGTRAGPGPCGTSPPASLWQFSLGRDVMPGFYMVDRIAPVDADPSDSGYAIISDERGIDLTGLDWVPDVADATEAVYSAFQTGTFRFLDTDVDGTGLTANVSQAIYSVSVLGMPQIGDLQAFLAARSTRGPAGDVLVKAPIPCFLSLSFDVRKRAATTISDLTPIQTAVADLVNTLGFAGQLHSSLVAGAVGPLLPTGAALSTIDMFGRIRRPDGSWHAIRSSEVLVVPTEGDAMVSGRTVVFILAPEDVAIGMIDAELEDV
jgi:hypothetical protein